MRLSGMDTPHSKKGNLFYWKQRVLHSNGDVSLAFRIAVASSHGHKDAVLLLIAKGANTGLKDLFLITTKILKHFSL